MKKILLIEDSVFYSDILTRSLEELKCEVVCAASVAEAKDCWENHEKFDCIILDLHIAPSGLDAQSINKYNPIFSWKWLEDTLEKIQPHEQKAFKQKTIIHSKYIRELKSRYKGQLDNYTFIEKKIVNDIPSTQKVIKKIKDIII